MVQFHRNANVEGDNQSANESWKGESEDDDSWEPLEHLTSCQELVEAFEERERDRSLSRTIGLGLRHS